jgi:hypothetical protein
VLGGHFRFAVSHRLHTKGGENVNVSMIRDLAHAVAREKARMGHYARRAFAPIVGLEHRNGVPVTVSPGPTQLKS